MRSNSLHAQRSSLLNGLWACCNDDMVERPYDKDMRNDKEVFDINLSLRLNNIFQEEPWLCRTYAYAFSLELLLTSSR